MINKEDKYRNELFELFSENLKSISDDEKILNLMSEIFKSDKIDSSELIEKLIKDEWEI